MFHTLDMMFSQRRGLKIGRKHRKIDMIKRNPKFIACDGLVLSLSKCTTSLYLVSCFYNQLYLCLMKYET
jgi:hypothetical protein